jgi:2'-5' RNA ligase
MGMKRQRIVPGMPTSGLRSAIVVTLRIPDALEAIRRRHLPVARSGVPAHVTIMSPFKPAEAIDDEVQAAVAGIAGAEAAFEVRFLGLGRFPGYLWAAPDPAEPFLRLTRSVVERYPDDHPFGHDFTLDAWVPHLTLAVAADEELERLERDALAADAFPFRAPASALDVLVETPGGRWRRWARLPLRR